MHLTGYCTGPFIFAVMLCVLRFVLRYLRAPLLALCLMSHLMLCIAPFLLLRHKKRLVRRASHIASRPVPRFLTPLVLAKLLCHVFAPKLAYIFPPWAASVILSLALRLNVDYHPMFPNIRVIIQTKKQQTKNS